MRNEGELMMTFRSNGGEDTPEFARDRVLLEVLLDMRSLLNKMVSANEEERKIFLEGKS